MNRGAALVLALVLAWAAMAKVRHRAVAIRGFTELGIPSPVRSVPLVVMGELAVAVGLVVVPTVAGPAAVVLLLGFSVVIARVLARGAPVRCGCFGASDEPLSWVDLLRNVLLVGGAVLASFGGDWPSLAELVVVTVAAACLGLGLSVLRLRRQVGSLLAVRIPADRRWSDG